MKGRRLHGAIGILFAPLAIYGACRIGKPDSAWARHRYGERRPKKQEKAERRFHPGRRTDRFKEAFRDMVGGKPSEGVAALAEQAVAATREAGEEMRAAAERVVHPEDPTMSAGRRPTTVGFRPVNREPESEAGRSASRTAGHSSSMTLK